MNRYFSSHPHLLWVSLVTSLCISAPARAGFGDAALTPKADTTTDTPAVTTAPASTSSLSPKGFGDVTATPGVAAIGEVDETSTTAPALWDKLKSGEIEPEAAWNAKELNAGDIEDILNNGESSDLKYRDLALKLVAVLDKHDTASIDDPAKQQQRARNLIVIYFEKQNDPRTVPYYEYIISLIKRPSPNVELSIFYLSDYYARIGDIKKAAETRLRYQDYSSNPDGISCSIIEAARLYNKIGEKQLTRKLYSQVAQYGYGWATGEALYFQALDLFETGDYEEARKFLTTPVTGKYAAQIEIRLLCALGDSYYFTGNFDQATNTFNSLLEKYKNIQNPLKGQGTEGEIAHAQWALAQIPQWEQKPIRALQQQLDLQVIKGEVIGKLTVFTPFDINLNIKSDIPAIVATVLPTSKRRYSSIACCGLSFSTGANRFTSSCHAASSTLWRSASCLSRSMSFGSRGGVVTIASSPTTAGRS